MLALARHDARKRHIVLIALAMAIFAFGALNAANPKPVHASTYPASYLIFYCEYQLPPNHVYNVWVYGYNQYGNLVYHQFPSYYTYDYPNYWWWEQGKYVDYVASYHNPDGSGAVSYSGSAYVWHTYNNYQSILSPVC